MARPLFCTGHYITFSTLSTTWSPILKAIRSCMEELSGHTKLNLLLSDFVLETDIETKCY